jgi:hypothetical protein
VFFAFLVDGSIGKPVETIHRHCYAQGKEKESLTFHWDICGEALCSSSSLGIDHIHDPDLPISSIKRTGEEER